MKQTKVLRTVGDSTRKNILKAAKTLFVKQGFAGTSISQIAKRADINQSLIYHHFKNKENLWRLVKAEMIKSHLADFSAFINNQNLTGEAMVRGFLRMRIEMSIKKPEIQKMFFWQYLEGGNKLLRYIPGFEIDKWLTLVKSLQTKKELRCDMHPRVILVLLSAQANGLMNYINDLDDAELRENCIQAAEDMLCNTLLKKNAQ